MSFSITCITFIHNKFRELHVNFVLIFVVQINQSLPVALHIYQSHLVLVLADVEPGTVSKPLLQHSVGHDGLPAQPPGLLVLPLDHHVHRG